MKLKRIGVLSCGLVSGVLYAIMGLLIGGVISFIAVLGTAMEGMNSGNEPIGMLFGIGAIIFAPIFYGFLGFVGGVIMAFVYNLVAGWTGGIEMEFDMPFGNQQVQSPPPFEQT